MQKTRKTIFGAGLAAVLFSLIGFKLFEFSVFGGLFNFGDFNLNIEVNIGSSETSTSDQKAYDLSNLREHIVTGKGKQICQNHKSDYSCQRIAYVLAKRNLAEKVKVVLSAKSILYNSTLTKDAIYSYTQAIITNQKIIYENYNVDKNIYTYILQATVGN